MYLFHSLPVYCCPFHPIESLSLSFIIVSILLSSIFSSYFPSTHILLYLPLSCKPIVLISRNEGGSEQDSSDDEDEDEDDNADRLFHLRPVTSADFTQAIKKLKASVDDNGKELMKVNI